MAVKSLATLRSDIIAAIATNTTGAITGDILQTQLVDLLDSLNAVDAQAGLSLVAPTGTPNGVLTSFTLPGTPSSDIVVFINGVASPEADYTVSGTTLTFGTAPLTGDVLTVLMSGASTPTAVNTASNARLGELVRIGSIGSIAEAYDDNSGGGFTLTTDGTLLGGTTGAWSAYLGVKGIVTTDERLTATAEICLTGARSSTSYGVSIGLRTVNSSWGSGFFAHYVAASGTANAGHLELYYTGSYGGTPTKILGALAFAPTQGDFVEVSISRDLGRVIARAKSLSSGAERTLYITGNMAASKNYILPNSCAVTVQHHGGSHEVVRVTLKSDSLKAPAIACFGDSKTQGYSAASIGARWSNRLAVLTSKEVSNYGGDGDRTAHCLSSISNYAGRFVTPVVAILAIGRNDLAGGVASGTWQANYSAIVTALKATGARVVHLLPVPETSLPDQSALKNWINSTYAADTRVDPSVGWVNGTHLSSDGIHPNAAGHQLIADAIYASGAV